MVKKLRNKFVIVTTALLVALFGGFLIVNTVHTNYWNGVEIVEMLDWIANSGIFTSFSDEAFDDEALIRDITKDESPIAGIILDKNGNIISSHVIGEGAKLEVPDDISKKMFEYKGEKRKVGKYYYSYNEQDNGTVLLVVMNSFPEKFTFSRVLGIAILLIAGIVLLEAIIFGLSRFVTKPAEQTLLREKQFISDAGHELKTPLGAISINAQALEMEFTDNLYIKNILSESGRMGRLLERLLVLSRFDEQEKVVLSKINLSEICEEMALTYESVAFEKQLKFDYEVLSNIEITGNADEIRQLLAILIDNAIKNSKKGGNISLSCHGNKKHGEITITNEGTGIPEDVIPHLFERFYTSDKSRSEGSFGLGLAIAKSIVERHGGTIRVKSIPDDITTFIVTI